MVILREKKININLVMADMNLSDRHGLEFIKIMEKETRLPIVMMCDPSDQQMLMDGLTSGAVMLGLVKPLSHHDIKNLWQLPILKRREILFGSRHPVIPRTPEIPESSGSQSKRRRMEEETELSRGISIGQVQPPSTVNCQATTSTALHPPSRTNNHGAMPRHGHNPLTILMRNPHSRDELRRIVMGARCRWEAQHGVVVNVIPGVRALNNSAPVQGHPHQLFISRPRIVIRPQLRQGPQPGISVNITCGGAQPGVSINISPGVGTLNNSALTPSVPQQQFRPLLVPVALATSIERFVYTLLNANYAHPGSMVTVPQGGAYEIVAGDVLDSVLELLAG